MLFKAFMFTGLFLLMANVQAQDLNNKNAAANLDLIELLGSLDNSSADTADDLDILEDAMQPVEARTIKNKPMTTKDNTHPTGGEK